MKIFTRIWSKLAMDKKTLQDYLPKCKHPIELWKYNSKHKTWHCIECRHHGKVINGKFFEDPVYRTKSYVVTVLSRMLKKIEESERSQW
jgi:hypothetical protein